MLMSYTVQQQHRQEDALPKLAETGTSLAGWLLCAVCPAGALPQFLSVQSHQL